MKIAAVIPAYNRPSVLRQCLASLVSQTRPLDEICIVDNSPGRDTGALVQSEFPGIAYCHFPENIGSAGGFNEGLRRVYGNNDWVWTLDDDITAQKNTVEEALARIPLLETRGSLGAFRVNYGDNPTDTAEFGTFAWRGTFIKSDIIRVVGFPDTEFFLYGEDVEYSLRIRKAGYRIYGVCAGRLEEIQPSPRSTRASWRFYSEPFRLYYAFRNQCAVYMRFDKKRELANVILYGIKGICYFLVTMRPGCIVAIAHGLFHGLRGKLGKNTGYSTA